MQVVGKKELKQLIAEAKEAGKDVSKLEAKLLAMKKEVKPKLGQKKVVKKTKKRQVIIQSTGPANKEDFK